MNSSLYPLIAYLIFSLFIAFYARKKTNKVLQNENSSFFEEYFLGSRSLGGFVLAMTVTASYASASSFIGGPGLAYTLGLSWVLLAMIQVPTTFLTLGFLGSRFHYISKQMQCLTITDFLYKRYNSSFLVALSSISMVIFFMAAMLAQFIGGARLFQAVTGYSYEVGLCIFAITVAIYTSVGGFRAVALSDALQGIIMLIAAFALIFIVVDTLDGIENAVYSLSQIDYGLISPYGPDNAVPIPMMLSFWVLVGIGILGLPQTVQKCMVYKDKEAMKEAMLIGTLIVGFLLLALHLSGAFGRVLYPNLDSGDLIIPTLTLELFPPLLAGIFIAGPLAAIMSTVDTMLLLSSAAIIKDLYIHFILKKDITLAHSDNIIESKKMRKLTILITFTLGIIVLIAALNPPSLLVWINLFAFGGLEVVFFFPFIFGLYYENANAKGAISSILCGLSAYIYFTLNPIDYYKINAIVPSLSISAVIFIIVSLATKDDKD